MLNPTRRRAPALSGVSVRRRQRGDIMLVTMVFLLVCLLGLIGSMRDTIVETNMVGNNLTRQKDVQVADIALQVIKDQIVANFGGLALDQAPNIVNKAWWRDLASTSAASPPTAAYWKDCLGNASTTLRCGSIPLVVGGTTLPYTALAVVQPTGRSAPVLDANSCAMGPTFQAVFYAVYVHVQEASGATNINTETVYKVCASNQ